MDRKMSSDAARRAGYSTATRKGQHATTCYVFRFRQKFGEPCCRRKLILLGEGLLSTAVNIFEGRRNLLWVKDLKQLITYCKSNISSMKIIGYIVNTNLIVILGDMDKDRE